MNAESVLMKVAGSARAYQPSPDEQPIIEFLRKQELIMKVIDGKHHGYHITLNGVKWRDRKFGRYQG